jgi:AcrR family transcriptional regulator
MVAGALQDYSPPDPESPRGRILAAARQLFADTGFEGTSTRLVAEAAGVNLAMIHYYYQNKERLYEQVMIGELLGLFHGVAGSLEKNLPIEEVLVSIPINLMLLLRDRPTWAKLFHREVASGGVHLRRIFRNMGDRGPAGAREIFRNAYEDGVKRGILRDLPAGSVHELLISIGYSALFFGSIISDLDGSDYMDEKTWNDRLKTLDTLLRKGLLVERQS